MENIEISSNVELINIRLSKYLIGSWKREQEVRGPVLRFVALHLMIILFLYLVCKWLTKF